MKRDFNKENVCSFCKGKKGWTFVHNNAPEKGPIFHPCYCEDGTRVSQLLSDLEIQKIMTKQERKSYEELRDYILKTSTCKTCHGDQRYTLGLSTCPECGLPGNCPWPG
jgi:hypothetical protein